VFLENILLVAGAKGEYKTSFNLINNIESPKKNINILEGKKKKNAES
jgi:hypothetical protein